ncbi:6678_t:CDS:1, partial [Cetraspora pellucida]
LKYHNGIRKTALCYLEGFGVKKDEEKAYIYSKKSLEKYY